MASLERFVEAQDAVWADVTRELAAGRKTSHWMWFVFPQLKVLGRSQMAKHFGLESLEDARAYLSHPVLGRRLRDAVGLVMAVEGKTALQIMGSPDDMKLRSCLTLFREADPDETIFERALDKYYGGQGDSLTLRWLQDQGRP